MRPPRNQKALTAAIAIKPVDGISFKACATGPQLIPEVLAQRLAAFRAKYPQRTLRKGKRSITEQLRNDPGAG